MKKLFTSILLLACTGALAEGYQVNLQSTKQSGMGHTGAGLKLGAESMHFNPAGLVFMDRSVDVSAGVSGVMATIKYKGDGALDGYSAKTDNPLSTPFYAYAGFSIYKNTLAAGIAVTTPYGSSLDWGRQWKGAATIQDISLQSFVFQPTVSVQIVEGLSFGAGLMVATGSFELSRALIKPEQFAAMAAVPGLSAGQIETINNLKTQFPASATLGGSSKVKVGYNLGLLFSPNDKISVGLSYRSKIKMGVKSGDAELNYLSSDVEAILTHVGQILPNFAIPPMDQGTFTASLPLPSNLTFGLGFYPNERWTLAFDLQYVGWKAYDKLVVDFNEFDYAITSEKNYKNTFAYRIGAQYAVTDRFDVRLGAYMDETPVRSNNYNPETPGANKVSLTTGFTFEPYKGLNIDFAFAVIRGFPRNGSYTNPLDNSVFEGEYSSWSFIPSLGVSYRF